jgi:DNA-directed RNA polymerase specialized sigma24 family protein
VAAKGKSGKSRKESAVTDPISANEKIARLLGILATKDMEQVNERVALLRAVGFSVSEVASILGMTENNVRVATHHGRKKHRARKAARRKKN